MSGFLESNSQFAGEAWIPGKLYDLGQYPGLCYVPEGTEVVWGEIFVMNNSNSVLGILDGYEGIFGKESDEYRRRLLPVFKGEDVFNCWVYEWAQFIPDHLMIPAGRYEHYYLQKESHRRFISS